LAHSSHALQFASCEKGSVKLKIAVYGCITCGTKPAFGLDHQRRLVEHQVRPF
jgi:hypothetical protein